MSIRVASRRRVVRSRLVLVREKLYIMYYVVVQSLSEKEGGSLVENLT